MNLNLPEKTVGFETLFNNLEAKVPGMKALNLTTADGFTLFSHRRPGFELNFDKLSAVTSSLTALSHAAAKQIVGSHFQSTCIETEMGLIFMVRTRYLDKTCILSLISGDEPNLGQIRFYLLKLSRYLSTATLSAENDS